MCECPNDAFGRVESSEKVYKIKVEKDICTMSMEELDKLTYEMNKILGHKLLRLLNVEDGCVELTYRGLQDDELTISEIQHCQLSELKVLSISYGDKLVIISAIAATLMDAVGEITSGKCN